MYTILNGQLALYLCLMNKNTPLRPDDHWLYIIDVINIVAGCIIVYVGVNSYRIPALIVFCLGLWFTSNKMRRDYSPRRARIRVAVTIVLALLLALVVYLFTN